MLYCSVLNCKDKDNHTVAYHLCTKCHQRGHSEIKHNSFIKNLLINICCDNNQKIYPVDKIPFSKYCEYFYCKNRADHTTDGHQCIFCKNAHNELECTNANIEAELVWYKCPFCRKLNNIRKIEYGHYQLCQICYDSTNTVKLLCCYNKYICRKCLVYVILSTKWTRNLYK